VRRISVRFLSHLFDFNVFEIVAGGERGIRTLDRAFDPITV
jgi:hypothetical protein